MSKSGVLLLSYGTPDDLADMRAYLLDIRGGRETPDELVEEMTARYRAIGGSPLNHHTYAQAEALQGELASRGADRPVYVGTRHWKPSIQDTVADMHNDGIEAAVALVLAPHYSSLSVGRYEEAIHAAQEAIGSGIRFTMVHSWWKQPRLIEAFEEKLLAAMARIPAEERAALKVIFSAHSLPARVLKMGDPYDDELKAHAQAMAERLGLNNWTFAYQSAGASAEPWLGPALEDELPRLAKEGCRRVLVAPLGFVCDHVEILYDIDIEAQEIAAKNDIKLDRIESMNETPLFIEAVADAIQQVGSE